MFKNINEITSAIIGAAIAVHRALGPGLLESAYHACLAIELVRRGLRIEEQVPLQLIYDGVSTGTAYRADFIVEGVVVIEVKSIERFERIHTAQMLSYLRLAKCRTGLLLNFNVKVLSADGVQRVVNGFGN